MQRMAVATAYGAFGGNKGLTKNLSAKNAPTPILGRGATERVFADFFEIEQPQKVFDGNHLSCLGLGQLGRKRPPGPTAHSRGRSRECHARDRYSIDADFASTFTAACRERRRTHADHAQPENDIYRWQRPVYEFCRKIIFWFAIE